ncbi:MAG: xylose isomerase [Acidobacteria bacterium]|nr:MAG: xylose isomerase [Acidobacteriota bacterium]
MVGRSSRRAFLGTAAATAAASMVPRRVLASPRPRGLKVGLASYSLRKFSLDQALAMCQAMDVRYITLKDVHRPMTATPDGIKAAVAKVRAAGIELMGGGVIYLKNDEAAVRRAFEYAKTAGFPLIVGAPDPDAVPLVERFVREYGIPLAIHNHGPEDKSYPAPQDALKLIKDRDRRLGLCMDVGHTVRAGADPVKTVAECGDRLMDLHVKDLRSATDRESQVEVGKGLVDYPGLIRALHQRRFSGHVALEYEMNEDHPEAGIRESLAYLRGVVDAVEAA